MDLDIIFFPFHDWKKCERQGWNERDAHLLFEIEKSSYVRRILVVDRPNSIPEIIRYPKNWKARKGKLVYRNGSAFLVQVREKIFVLDQVIFEIFKPIQRHRWWAYVMGIRKTTENIRRAIEYLGLRYKILFLANPFAANLIQTFNEKLSVFDAIDDFTRHSGMLSVKEEIAHAYKEIKEKVDVIFTVSQELKKFFSQGRNNVFQIPNAVDIHFFEKRGYPCPSDLRNIRKPIAGYLGQTEGKIDIELMEYLTSNMPDVNFVFVGRTRNKKSIRRVLNYPNIFFLGEKHYSVIPSYLSYFDVCLLPHKVDDFTNNMNPQKLYEYLSIGKPVVSTPVAGVEVFSKVMRIAGSREEFLLGVRESLNDDPVLINLRIETVRPHSWRNRAESMLQQIVEAISAKERS